MKYCNYLAFLMAVCCFCFMCTSAIAQTLAGKNELQATIELQARKFIHFALSKEVDSLLAYAPPQFLQVVGKKTMQELLNQKKTQAPAPKANYEISFEGTDQVLLHQQNAQCAFYYTVKDASTKAIEIERGAILGFSNSTHQHWYFLGISAQSLPKYKELLPEDLHPKLRFPPSSVQIEISTNIPWRLKPFLEVQEPVSYNEKYGQIVFSNGLRNNSLYGLINLKGEIIHQPIYAHVLSYQDELMFLDKQTIKYSLVHRSNPKKLFPEPNYSSEQPFDEYRFASSGFYLRKVGRDSFLLYNPQSHEEKLLIGKIEINHEFIHVKRGTVAVYNSRGKLIIPQGKYIETGTFKNHYSTWAKVRSGEFVIIDTSSNILKTWELESIFQSDEEKYFTSSLKKNGQFHYGLLDEQGNELLPPTRENIRASNYSIYALLQKDKWSIYNFKGEKVLKKEYNYAEFEGDYLLLESEKPKTFEIYDQHLKLIKTLSFDQEYLSGELLKDEKTGQVLVQISDLYGQHHLYPLQGPVVTEENTSNHRLIPGAIIFKKGEKEGIVALDGTMLIPATLDEIVYHGSQSIWGRIGSKWGLLAIE